MGKIKITAIVYPKSREDQTRIKAILTRKGFTLERVTDSASHYFNKLNSLISVRKRGRTTQ
jgi:hypothetical protein